MTPRSVAAGNYRVVDSANPGFGPQRTMSFGELAAFIAMFFWMDDAKAPAAPHGAFFPAAGKRDQVAAITTALQPGGGIPNNNRVFNNWATLMADAGVQQNLAEVHTAVGKFLTNLQNWDGCSSVGLDMVQKIANLT